MSKLEANQEEFETLLSYIKRNRGFDFTGYKRSSLMRRVQKRMQLVEIDSFNEYLDYLEVHPEEFIHLFNTILINVTSFFRDHFVWDYVAAEIVPRIIAQKEISEQIRIWSAGCAAGQEAYTLAMIMAEVLGVEQYRERVKIYATDLDDDALNQARQALYSSRELIGIPTDLLAKYFEPFDHRYSFSKDLRRNVIFGRHDLIQDAPISRIDLLTCRNTLMYFNSETQAKIISRFHFALRDGGFLLLGKAEMLFSQSNLFTPIDLKRRLVSKLPKANARERLSLINRNNDQDFNHVANHVRLRDAAFDASLVAQVVIDINGVLVLANERMRSLFNLSLNNIGKPLQDLEISYRPVELRSCIELAYSEHRSITVQEVCWITNTKEKFYLDVQILPLSDCNGNLLGVNISFADVTRSKRLKDELEHSNQELEMAYEELQSTNEELETTNEELQSSNEELETTNEELQSTNEELETINEELHSSNEELQTMNEELRIHSDQVNELNAFLESILTSLRTGVVVVDRDLVIQIWNHIAEELWGLRAQEVLGQHFLNLDIGLPVEQLRQTIRSCLNAKSEYIELTLSANNRRGKKIQCQITCTPLFNMARDIKGVIMLMEENGLRE